MAEEIHVLKAIFGSDTSQFARGVEATVSGLGRVKSAYGGLVSFINANKGNVVAAIGAIDTAVSRLAATAAGMATVTVAAIAKMGVAYNQMREDTMTSFTTLLGSGEKAKAMWSELSKLAGKPINMEGLADATKMLLGMGYAGNQIPRMLKAVSNATAAMGKGTEFVNGVTLALGQIKAKGVVAAEEMLQLAERGIPAWDMLAKHIGTDVPTAMKLVEQRAISSDMAIEAVLKGIEGKYDGMTEKLAGTFSGLWASLMNTVQTKSGKIMEPVYNATKRVLGQLVNYLGSSGFNTFIGQIQQRIKLILATVEMLWRSWTRGGLNAEQIVLALLDVIHDLFDWLQANQKQIAEFGKGLMSWITPIGELIQKYPQLLLFFGLFQVGRLLGINNAVWQTGKAIFGLGVSIVQAAIPSGTQNLRSLWSLLSQNVWSNFSTLSKAAWAAFVDGYNRAQIAASQGRAVIATSLIPVVAQLGTAANAAQLRLGTLGTTTMTVAQRAQEAVSGTKLLGSSVGSVSTFVQQARPLLLGYAGGLSNAASASRALIESSTPLQTTARVLWSTWGQEVGVLQQSTSTTISAARAKEILASTARTRLIPSLQQMGNVLRGIVGGGMNVLRTALSSVASGFLQMGRSAMSGMTAMKGMGAATVVAGLVMLGVQIWGLVSAQRALNLALSEQAVLDARIDRKRRREQQTAVAQVNDINDPAAKAAAIKQKLELAKKNAAGASSGTDMARKALKEEAQRRGLWDDAVEAVNGKDPVLEQMKNDVTKASQHEEEMHNYVYQWEDMLREATRSAQDVTNQSDGSTTGEGDQSSHEKGADVPDFERPGRDKKIGKERTRFDEQMKDLFDRGLPPAAIEKLREQFNSLSETFAEGRMSAEDYDTALKELDRTAEKRATTESDTRAFGERLREAIDQGLPADIASSLYQQFQKVGEAYASGAITTDQYGLATNALEKNASFAQKRSDETRDFGIRANEYVNDGKLSQKDADGFIGQLKSLQQSLATGEMTTFQYEGKLKELNNTMQNAVQKSEAMGKAEEDIYKTLAQIRESKNIGLTDQGRTDLWNQVAKLNKQLELGKISLKQYGVAIETVSKTLENDAERAYRTAMLQGNWAAAGLDPWKAAQDKIIELRQQQFNQQVDLMVSNMTGLGGAFQGLQDQSQNLTNSFGQQIQNLDQSLQSMGLPSLKEAGDAINQFLNSKDGVVANLQNQIALLQQSLQIADTYTIQQRILGQIEDLNKQLSAALSEDVQIFGPVQGNANYTDPGLNNGNTTININAGGLTRLTDADIYNLTDRITREQNRRGNR